MRVFIRVLLYTSRTLAVCACLVAVAAGLLTASLIAGFTCFDSCPGPQYFFSRMLLDTMLALIPCVALTVLALVTFAGYCRATGQTRRAFKQTVILLGGAVVGVVALGAVFQICRATLPVAQNGQVVAAPAVAWMEAWGLTIIVVAGAWSGLLARLQWGHTVQRNLDGPV